jgi:TolB-like protein
MKTKVLFGFIVMCFLITNTYAEDKMRVAILDLQSTNVSKATARGVSDMIRTDLIDMGIFTVVERSQMTEILKEQGFQQTGCTDSACAVKLGKLVSAKKILVGEISKIGTAVQITVRIVDVESGVAEFASSEKAANENKVDEASHNLSLKLAERITGKRGSELLERAATVDKTGYYVRGIVPGWGQFYAKQDIKGIAFAAAFVGSAAWCVIANKNYSDSKKKYNDMPKGLPQSEYDSAYDKYKKDGKLALYSVILVSCVYLANWADILFFSTPNFENKITGLNYNSNVYANIDIGQYSVSPQSNLFNSSELKMNFSVTTKF